MSNEAVWVGAVTIVRRGRAMGWLAMVVLTTLVACGDAGKSGPAGASKNGAGELRLEATIAHAGKFPKRHVAINVRSSPGARVVVGPYEHTMDKTGRWTRKVSRYTFPWDLESVPVTATLGDTNKTVDVPLKLFVCTPGPAGRLEAEEGAEGAGRLRGEDLRVCTPGQGCAQGHRGIDLRRNPGARRPAHGARRGRSRGAGRSH